jgi:hypothetical protein
MIVLNAQTRPGTYDFEVTVGGRNTTKVGGTGTTMAVDADLDDIHIKEIASEHEQRRRVHYGEHHA